MNDTNDRALEPAAARTRRVLVVDDEPLLIHLLQRVLESSGYEVLGASNGREALEVLASQPVNLVLSDVRMPEMDGPTFLVEMRRRHPQAPPLVFLTGYGDYSDRELRAMGAVEVLSKPVTSRALLEAVDAHAIIA